jgi:hypothetical protein
MNTIIEGNDQFNDWFCMNDDLYPFMGVGELRNNDDMEITDHIATSMCVNKRADYQLNFGGDS